MPERRSNWFESINIGIAALFLISAALQFNDPDPILWIAIYGAAGLGCLLARRWSIAWWLVAAVAVVSLGWSASMAPRVIPTLQPGHLVESMKASTPQIEEGREMLGLLIVGIWTTLVAVRHRSTRRGAGRTTAVLFVLIGAGATDVAAWGSDGHRIACEIAYRRIDDRTRAVLLQLRQGDTAATFAESCMWADRVRHGSHPQTHAYHYVNIPPTATGFDLARDCPAPERCVTWAIAYYRQRLADAAIDDAERAMALKFLAHFVADLHQPLHAGRKADRGGNRIRVTLMGRDSGSRQPLNLHSAWDTAVLRRADLRWPAAAVELDAGITPGQVESWRPIDLPAWTDESRDLAERAGYRDTDGDPIENGDDLGEGYYRRALDISRRQLQRAGVRLALLLDESLAGSPD